MFRDAKKSELNAKHFGAGSLIKFGSFESHLVVAENDKTVAALNMQDFTLSGSIVCNDCNHLTEDEARRLVNAVASDCTFSDAELDAKGMKK